MSWSAVSASHSEVTEAPAEMRFKAFSVEHVDRAAVKQLQLLDMMMALIADQDVACYVACYACYVACSVGPAT